MSELDRHSQLERAKILLQQRRYKDAEEHAAAILRNNPNDAEALQIIGHCRLDNKQPAEAIQIFQQCLGLEPDNDYVHYLLGFAHYRNGNRAQAVVSLQHALRLNPYASGYYGLYAFILLDENQYAKALEKANEGLAMYAQDLTCLNARSQALFRLKDKDAAYDTIKEALSVNPDDDFTHTNYGWHFMEMGKHKKAMEHFRLALRINPNNNRARHGYKESLKAKLPPYRWMLMFSLWLAAKSKKARWAIIIVIWSSVQILSRVSDSSGWSIVAYSIIALYILFVVFSWVGTSIANIMLLLSSEGRYVLTKPEKYSAWAVGACILAAVTVAIFGGHLPGVTDDYRYFAAMILLTLSLPVSRFEYKDILMRRKYAYIFTIALTAVGLIATACLLTLPTNKIITNIGFVYLGGLAVYTWFFSFVRG